MGGRGGGPIEQVGPEEDEEEEDTEEAVGDWSVAVVGEGCLAAGMLPARGGLWGESEVRSGLGQE